MIMEDKELRDILGCMCSYDERYDGRSFNLKTEKYEDCECVEKLAQLKQYIANQAEEAFELGKIHEAKICEQAQRHQREALLKDTYQVPPQTWRRK